MPAIIGAIELTLKSDDSTSVEDLRSLLQAIRDWEQKTQVDIFLGVNAPGITKDEIEWILDNMLPPFKKRVFIPLKKI